MTPDQYLRQSLYALAGWQASDGVPLRPHWAIAATGNGADDRRRCVRSVADLNQSEKEDA